MTAPIITGYDPGSHDLAPVTFGLAAARFTGAPLIIASVHGGAPSTHGVAADELGEEQREMARQALEQLPKELADAAEVPVEVRMIEAHSVARGIHRAVEEASAGLVVVGSSRRAAGRLLTGSTAERVIHGAPCPVAVVPHDHAPRPTTVVGVAYVPSPEGDAALHAAAVLASAAEAKLRVITLLKPELGAVEGAHPDPRGVRPNEGREEAAASHEERMKAAIAKAFEGAPEPPEHQVDIYFGEPAQALRDVSRHIDLLVMGSRGYGPHKAVLLGGVSRQVVGAAACPVVVIPRGATRPLEDMLSSPRPRRREQAAT